MATPDLKSYIGKRIKHAKMMEINKRFTDGDESGEQRKSKLKSFFSAPRETKEAWNFTEFKQPLHYRQPVLQKAVLKANNC